VSAVQDAVEAEPRAFLRARCISGTWGGSHLLSFAGGEKGRRLPRRLNAAGGFSTAWGIHLRERLGELGYLDAEDRLLTLFQRRSLFETAIADLDLHLGRIDAGQAHARLAAVVGMPSTDLIHMGRHPGALIAGALGVQDIEDARERAVSRAGASDTEEGFYDRLLGCGPVPLAIALESCSVEVAARRHPRTLSQIQ
jgi:uncharacterized protein (DUF885 family)